MIQKGWNSLAHNWDDASGSMTTSMVEMVPENRWITDKMMSVKCILQEITKA